MKALESNRTTENANASLRRVLRNVVLSYAALVVSLISGFVVTPIVLDTVGPAQFGAFALVAGLVGYLGLVDLGVGTTTSNRVAQLGAKDDRQALGVMLATSFWLFVGAALLGALAAVVVAFGLTSWFEIPKELGASACAAFVILAVSQQLALPLSIFGHVLNGSGRADLAATRTIVITTTSSLGQVAAAKAGAGVVGLALASGLCGLAGSLLMRRQAVKLVPDMRLSRRYFSRPLAGDLVGVGTRNAVISVAGMISFTSDLTVLAALLPVSTVASYAVASKLVSYTRLASARLSDVLMPVYAHGHALAQGESQRQVFVATTTVSLAIATPMTIVLVALGSPLLDLWLGQALPGSVDVLIVLSLASLAQLPGHNCFLVLTATERTRTLLRVSLISAFANLALSIVLTLRYGLVGPAVASLAVSLVADFVLLPIVVCRTFGWPVRQTLLTVLRPVCVAAVPVIGLCWFAASVGSLRGWPTLPVAALAFFTYQVFAWLVQPRDRRMAMRARARASFSRLGQK